MSAAKAISDHLRDWLCTKSSINYDSWVSMAVYSTGSGYPSVPDDLFFSLPVICSTNGQFSVKNGLTLSEATEVGIEKSAEELIAEREEALTFLKVNKHTLNFGIYLHF